MDIENTQTTREETTLSIQPTNTSESLSTDANLPTTSKQTKKASKKKFLVVAVILVLLIALIGKAAKSGSSSDAEKEVKSFLQSMGYQVTNVKTEYKAKYKVHNVDENKWEKTEFSFVSATLMGSYSEDVQYVLVSCEICGNDLADLDIEYQTDSRAVLKNVIRSHIEDTKQLLKDAKDTGELR